MNVAQASPAAPSTAHSTKWWARQMLNKVPEVTLYFWLIKILCTTVGETFADNLNENLGLGLSGTSYVMTAVLIVALIFQFRSRRYVPGIYWLAVVLISVVGTLITDNLVEQGVTLEATTIGFALALIGVFAVWYAVERTLSVHTIYTTRRESFYWLAILFTFALGTASGDFLSEKLELGYLAALGIFAGAIIVVTVLHFGLRMNAILSFWLAYILTRPLGASIGDYLAQPTEEGGLGLGTNLTSIIFLAAILGLVVFLAVTKRDVIRSGSGAVADLGVDGSPAVLVVLNKVEATAALLDAVKQRTAAGAARFFVLVPNPDHVGFDRNRPDSIDGEALLTKALTQMQSPAKSVVSGRVAESPNAYDDIVAALDGGNYHEIILETPPTHLSHWLHVDLPERLAHLGYPLTTVTATG
ncbi:MAG TPA: hypothetical protein VLK30_04020 [Candidatus Limnocylindrales bacterium]|nr:hypothetical protein [Candidatus Limnocylindrales bacterium]